MSAKRGCVSLAGKYVLSSLKKYYLGGGTRRLLKKQPTRGRGGKGDNFLGNRSRILSAIRLLAYISTVCIEFCFPTNFQNSCLAVLCFKFYALLAEMIPRRDGYYIQIVYASTPPHLFHTYIYPYFLSLFTFLPQREADRKRGRDANAVTQSHVFCFNSDPDPKLFPNQTDSNTNRDNGDSLLKFSFGSWTETERTRYGFNSGARL